jgi:hypothetical protein
MVGFPFTQSFHMASYIFFPMLCTKLGLLHPSSWLAIRRKTIICNLFLQIKKCHLRLKSNYKWHFSIKNYNFLVKKICKWHFFFQCGLIHMWPTNRFDITCYDVPKRGQWYISIHDVVRNVFACIFRNVGFHVSHEQTYVLPSPFFQSSHQWVNTMFTLDGVSILVDVVIIEPVWMDLVSKTTIS